MSPYLRGYSAASRDVPHPFLVVPVYAGVFRERRVAGLGNPRCPRVRGGIPPIATRRIGGVSLSPCTRGYSVISGQATNQARYPRMRGGIPFPVVFLQQRFQLSRIYRGIPGGYTCEYAATSCPRVRGGIPGSHGEQAYRPPSSPCTLGYSH